MGDGASPAASSFARTNRSTSLCAQCAASFTAGTADLRIGWKDQCLLATSLFEGGTVLSFSGHGRPIFTHSVSAAMCSSESFGAFSGIMYSDSWRMLLMNVPFDGSPG